MLDFKDLNDRILLSFTSFISDLLPGGKMTGREYVCGSVSGGPGGSFSVNSRTGIWCEFAGGHLKGGDLISLYAAVKGIGQADAFKELCKQYGSPSAPSVIQVHREPNMFTSAPDKHELPKFGKSTAHWAYRDIEGRVMFYIARYDGPEGKIFSPFSWNGEKWVKKGWPSPRPLYNLEKIVCNPKHSIVIVEGEKAAEACKSVLFGSNYVATTWPNGANSVKNVDYSPLNGRSVLIWPDNDAAGIKAGLQIKEILEGVAGSIKIINPTGKSDGWDAADAMIEGMTWAQFKPWAIERVAVPFDDPEHTLAEIIDQRQDADISGNMKVIWDNLGLPVNAGGKPIVSMTTVDILLNRSDEFRQSVWVDKFHQQILTTWNGDKPRFWSDTDTLRLTHALQSRYGIQRINKETVYDGVCVHASYDQRNEPRDWMNSLEWDGTPRVSGFLPIYMGSSDTEYERAASQNWWIALVARIFEPGCQVDNTIILKSSKQGTGKTSTLRIIGGQWYASAGHDILAKDFYISLQGKLVIEVDELTSFSRGEIESVKSTITRKVDRYRAVYGKIAEDHPRQCVFTATTNDDCPLKDRTGNRRFWPVEVPNINLPAIEHDRNQLFAEAVHLYKSGTKWHLMPGITDEHQQENLKEDPWQEPIEKYIVGKDKLTLHQVADSALKIPNERMRMDVFDRIAFCLRASGWIQKGRSDGKRAWINPKFDYAAWRE